jgi:DNA-binding response OmpR family regulator
LRVLLVEDSEHDTPLLLRELRRGGYELEHVRVSMPEEMEKALGEASSRGEPYEIVLSAYHMPRFGALASLETLWGSGYDTPYIVVSGKIGEDAAVEMMRARARDYVTKDGSLAALDEAADALRRSVEGLRGAIFELRLKEALGDSYVSSVEVLLDLNRRMARGTYQLELVADEGFPRTLPERNRARELGGELEVVSAPGSGTCVRFEIPDSRLIAGDGQEHPS